MKAVLILAPASLAVAQNLSGQPTCATSCISAAISAAGCAPSDVGCQCGPTQSVLASFAAPCLLKACPVSDLIIAQSVGSELCAVYSSTAGLTTAGTTATSTSITITSTTATPSSTSQSTTAGTTTTGTTAIGTTTTSTSSTSKPAAQSTNMASAATPFAVGALAALMGVIAAI